MVYYVFYVIIPSPWWARRARVLKLVFNTQGRCYHLGSLVWQRDYSPAYERLCVIFLRHLSKGWNKVVTVNSAACHKWISWLQGDYTIDGY